MDVTSDEYLNMICPVCGNRFHLKPSAVKRFKNHYCSKKCHYEAKKEYMKGEKNHQFGLVGSKNDSWRGGTRITRYGYRLVQCIGHPFATKTCDYMFEHRLVAEKYLLLEFPYFSIGRKSSEQSKVNNCLKIIFCFMIATICVQ